MSTKKFKLVLLNLGILIALISVLALTNPSNQPTVETNFNQPKTATLYETAYIHVDNNWTDTQTTYAWCTGGNGSTYATRFIIENEDFDGTGYDIGMLIENSAVFFEIRHCAINSTLVGILLNDVSNGRIYLNQLNDLATIQGKDATTGNRDGEYGKEPIGILVNGSQDIVITENNIQNLTAGDGGDADGTGIGGDGGHAYGILCRESSEVDLTYNIIQNIQGGIGGDIDTGTQGGEGGDGYGIHLKDVADSLIQLNNITNITGGNGIAGGGTYSYGGFACGIYTYYVDAIEVLDNEISVITGGQGSGHASGHAKGIQGTFLKESLYSDNTIFNIFGGDGLTSGDDGKDGYGIHFLDSSFSEFTRNEIFNISAGKGDGGSSHDGYVIGCDFFKCFNNSIVENTISALHGEAKSGVFGAYILRSDGNEFLNNIIANLSTGAGSTIHTNGLVLAYSNFNTISNNHIVDFIAENDDSLCGIEIESESSYNVIANNEITNFQQLSEGDVYGILMSANHNEVRNNEITYFEVGGTNTNLVSGIYLDAANFSYVSQNLISHFAADDDSDLYGLALDASTSNEIDENIISDFIGGDSGSLRGIYLMTSDNSIITSNNITDILSSCPTSGILGTGSESTEVRTNRIENITYIGATDLYGISFEAASHFTFIEGNEITILNCTAGSVYAVVNVESDECVQSNNIISHLSGGTASYCLGIYVISSDFNSVEENAIQYLYAKTAYGIYITQSPYGSIAKNVISHLYAHNGTDATVAGTSGTSGGISKGIICEISDNGTIYQNEISNLFGGDGGNGMAGDDGVIGDHGGAGGAGGKCVGLEIISSDDVNISSNQISSFFPGNGGDGANGGTTTSGVAGTVGGNGGAGGASGQILAISILNSKNALNVLNHIYDMVGGNGGSGANGGSGGLNGIGGYGGSGGVGGMIIAIQLDNVDNGINVQNTLSVFEGGRGGAGGIGVDGGAGGTGGTCYIIFNINSNGGINKDNAISYVIGGSGGNGGMGTNHQGNEYVGGAGGDGGPTYAIFSASGVQQGHYRNTISNCEGGSGGNGETGETPGVGGDGGISYGVYLTDVDDSFYFGNHISVMGTSNGGEGSIVVYDGNPGLGYGFYIDASSTGNTFFHNMIYTEYNRDASSLNSWNITSVGNYWEFYSGIDADANGIGDTPYLLSAESLVQDELPLMTEGSYSNDLDMDGLSNDLEIAYGTDPDDFDSDDDGVSDGAEIHTYHTNATNDDSDEDNLGDWDEIFIHLTNPNNNDTDSDLLRDDLEFTHGCDPFDNDTDDDTLFDGFEVKSGLDPLVSNLGFDQDQDTIPDVVEYSWGLNPTSSNVGLDSDDDMLSDILECNNYSTDPLSSDTDSDEMPDGWEILFNLNPLDDSDGAIDADNDLLLNVFEYMNATNPNLNDTDDDGIFDGFEVLKYRTDPRNNDTDSDFMPDGWEIENYLDPLLANGYIDSDFDGLANLEEYEHGTDPWEIDTDNDGLTDEQEVHHYLTDPLKADSDGDGVIDILELFEYGTDPNDPEDGGVDNPTGDIPGDSEMTPLTVWQIVGISAGGVTALGAGGFILWKKKKL